MRIARASSAPRGSDNRSHRPPAGRLPTPSRAPHPLRRELRRGRRGAQRAARRRPGLPRHRPVPRHRGGGHASWAADRARLEEAGYAVRALRERPGFIEAEVSSGGETVRIEWTRDSAYRFFPLVEHPDLGLAFHPFDLATNKLLALIGRREARDWVDVLQCDLTLQPLGYLAWAACGKDPGFSPASILEHAARNGRFAPEEIEELAFTGERPSPSDLARRWHEALVAAREVVEVLPAGEAGNCVLLGDDLCRLAPAALAGALARGAIRFRTGSIRGAFPTLRPG